MIMFRQWDKIALIEHAQRIITYDEVNELSVDMKKTNPMKI